MAVGFRSILPGAQEGSKGRERGEQSGDSTADPCGELNDFIHEQLRETLWNLPRIFGEEVPVKEEFAAG